MLDTKSTWVELRSEIVLLVLLGEVGVEELGLLFCSCANTDVAKSNGKIMYIVNNSRTDNKPLVQYYTMVILSLFCNHLYLTILLSLQCDTLFI